LVMREKLVPVRELERRGRARRRVDGPRREKSVRLRGGVQPDDAAREGGGIGEKGKC